MSYTVAKFNDKVSYSEDAAGKPVYGVKYIVESTTANDHDIRAARLASGVPQRGSAFEYDSGAFVSGVSLEEHYFTNDTRGKTIFIFNVEYSVNTGELNLAAASDDPTEEPPKISYSTAKYTVPFELAYDPGDLQGDPSIPVLNSAKCKYDPPAVTDRVNTVINVQFNSRSWNGNWPILFTNTVNMTSINVAGHPIPAGCGRVNDIGASSAYDADGKLYWTISVQIEISKEGFEKKILDCGMMALNSSGQLDNIYVETDSTEKTSTIKLKSEIDAAILSGTNKTKSAEPVSEPKNLDGGGGLLAQDGDPVYKVYQAFYEASWNSLNMPKTRNG